MSRLLLSLPMTLMALSAQAEPTRAACEARAARVVQQLERAAGAPLSRPEGRLAWSAALAACQGDDAPPAGASAVAGVATGGAPAPSEAPNAAGAAGSRFDRFVKGLFAMDTEMARKRPGGKARYREKD